MELSIIVTCKGRIEHLKRTLSRMMFQFDVSQEDYEIILIDYGDPDHCGAWAVGESKMMKFKNLKAIQVRDNIKKWNPSRSRNIGARQSCGDILFFSDADILLGKTDVSRVIKHFKNHDCLIWRRDVLVRGRGKGDLNGTFACTRDAFFRLRGYNELAIGWALEDIDLYQRAEVLGKSCVLQDGDLERTSISHGWNLRQKFVDIKNPNESKKFYMKKFYESRGNVNPAGWGMGKIKII